MLILTRKEGERIFLDLPDGTRVVVTVAMIDRDKVRVGVAAPRGVQIMRSELSGGWTPNRKGAPRE